MSATRRSPRTRVTRCSRRGAARDAQGPGRRERPLSPGQWPFPTSLPARRAANGSLDARGRSGVFLPCASPACSSMARRLSSSTLTDSVVVRTPTESVSRHHEACTRESTKARATRLHARATLRRAPNHHRDPGAVAVPFPTQDRWNTLTDSVVVRTPTESVSRHHEACTRESTKARATRLHARGTTLRAPAITATPGPWPFTSRCRTAGRWRRAGRCSRRRR